MGKSETLATLITGGFVGLAFGFLAMGLLSNTWKAEAIEHGCAGYDPKTGEWHWIKGGGAE